jgi:hypothetical protein
MGSFDVVPSKEQEQKRANKTMYNLLFHTTERRKREKVREGVWEWTYL